MIYRTCDRVLQFKLLAMKTPEIEANENPRALIKCLCMQFRRANILNLFGDNIQKKMAKMFCLRLSRDRMFIVINNVSGMSGRNMTTRQAKPQPPNSGYKKRVQVI